MSHLHSPPCPSPSPSARSLARLLTCLLACHTLACTLATVQLQRNLPKLNCPIKATVIQRPSHALPFVTPPIAEPIAIHEDIGRVRLVRPLKPVCPSLDLGF